MRREQNLALLGAVVSGAVVAVGLLLLLIARVNPETGGRLRGVLLDLLSPVWTVVKAPFDGAARLADDTGDYFGAVSENARLEAELDAANARLRAAAADVRATRQLKALLAVREPSRRVITTTRIVAATPGSVVRSAMIAAGIDAGVTPGLPVIGADGLIGRTVEAGDSAARVLLLTDPASRVPVIVARTGQAGLVAGRNRPALALIDLAGQALPTNIKPLVNGDRIVTSGDGGVFPPGVPVGIVIDARADPPLIRPAATALGAGYVTVEAAWLPVPEAEAGPIVDAPVPAEARVKGAPQPRLRGTEAVVPP
jgi:rod shape-determining protein MreC